MIPIPPAPVSPKRPRWFLIIGIIILIGAVSYASYWYFISKQNLSFNVDLSQSSASVATDSTLTLTPSSNSLVVGQSGYIDITVNAGATTLTAVELRITITGPATITSLDTTNSSFSTVLVAPVTTTTTSQITLGSGTTGKTGDNLHVARLNIATSQTGTVSISTTGTQAAGSAGSGNVLATPPSATLTIVPVTVALPTATFSASSTTIKTGQLLPSSATSTTLSWTHNGSSATISPSIGVTVNPSGTNVVSPTTTTTYTLTATNTGGSTIRTVVITVVKACNLDGDGDVDIFDYNALVGNFGKAGVGDIDANGKVDIFDYNSFVSNYATQKTTTP